METSMTQQQWRPGRPTLASGRRGVRKSRLAELEMAVEDHRRIAFANFYVQFGGKGSGAKAARAAGYSDRGSAAKVRASELLRDDHVRALILYLSEGLVVAEMPSLTQNLLELARSARPEDAVKLRAINSAMDRGGMVAVDQSRIEIEQNVAIEHHVDVRRVADRISQLVGYRVDLDETDYHEIPGPDRESGLVAERDVAGPRRQGRSAKAITEYVPAPMKPFIAGDQGGDADAE
jgi:phage terminase small subunit